MTLLSDLRIGPTFNQHNDLGLDADLSVLNNVGVLVGVAIRLRRERLGWSQQELGTRSGLNKNTITRIEKGRGNRLESIDLVTSALSKGEREQGLSSAVVGVVEVAGGRNEQAE